MLCHRHPPVSYFGHRKTGAVAKVRGHLESIRNKKKMLKKAIAEKPEKRQKKKKWGYKKSHFCCKIDV
jgi:hypothetical protein